jgi:hypothetical protein
VGKINGFITLPTIVNQTSFSPSIYFVKWKQREQIKHPNGKNRNNIPASSSSDDGAYSNDDAY